MSIFFDEHRSGELHCRGQRSRHLADSYSGRKETAWDTTEHIINLIGHGQQPRDPSGALVRPGGTVKDSALCSAMNIKVVQTGPTKAKT